MIARGIDHGIALRMLPIHTVGLPVRRKYWVWLFEQRRVEVLEPFEVPRPNGGSYIIPAGFQFDGGSIPRWLLVLAVIVRIVVPPEWGSYGDALLAMVLVGLLIERFGLMLLAFAVHDFAVRYGLLVTGDGEVEQIPDVRSANSVMRRVNFATNDMILIGWVAHMAVVAGAWMAWRRHRAGKVERPDWRTLDYGVTPHMPASVYGLSVETTR